MKQALSQPNVDPTEALMIRAGVKLTEDEKVVASGRIHGAVYWKGVAVFIFGLFLLPTIATNLGFLFMFVGAVMLGLAHLTRFFLILAATNKRVFVRSGILYADMIELRYSQVESVEIGITPIGQIFGYGTVIITGTGQRRMMIPFITEAVTFRSKVNDILVDK